MNSSSFAAADMRLAYTLTAAYGERDTATMAVAWDEAVRKSATVDLLSAVLAALFDTAPELRERVPQMRAAAAEFVLIEQMDESQLRQAHDAAALAALPPWPPRTATKTEHGEDG